MEELIPFIESVKDLGLNNKAKVVVASVNHSNEVKYLISYESVVAYIKDGIAHELPCQHSPTTARHIKAFYDYYGIKPNQIVKD